MRVNICPCPSPCLWVEKFRAQHAGGVPFLLRFAWTSPWGSPNSRARNCAWGRKCKGHAVRSGAVMEKITQAHYGFAPGLAGDKPRAWHMIGCQPACAASWTDTLDGSLRSSRRTPRTRIAQRTRMESAPYQPALRQPALRQGEIHRLARAAHHDA